MSYIYTGDSRSFSVTVTKYINGVPQTPVTYPTATDIANGYFTYSGGQVPIPTTEELAQMDASAYAAVLIALQTYAQEQNPGLNFATATVVVPAVITEDPNCPPSGTPVTTTTTTVAPPTTTTTLPPIGIAIANASDDQYISQVTIGNVSPVPLVGGSFPLAPGQSTTGYTDLTGAHQINVHFTNASTGVGSVTVVDSDTVVTCADFNTWDDPLEFYAQNIQVTPIVTITANAIPCDTTTTTVL